MATLDAMEVLRTVKNNDHACLQKGSETKGTVIFIYLNGSHVVVDRMSASKYWGAGPKKKITLAESRKAKPKVPAGMTLRSFKTKKAAQEYFDKLVDKKLDEGFTEFTPH